MPARMSCALTIPQVRARMKTATRRHKDSWKSLRPGDRLTLIEKGMGLPKGSRQVVLCEVEVTSVRVEPLYRINDPGELAAEGFPGMSTAGFVRMWADAHGYRGMPLEEASNLEVRRIEWRYLGDGE